MRCVSEEVLDAIPELKAIAIRAMKLEFLTLAYSAGEVAWVTASTPMLELGFASLYPFLSGLRLEESMPSFEASARRELRRCFARRQPLSTEACLLAEHQKSLESASQGISAQLDDLYAGMRNKTQKEQVKCVQESFLNGSMAIVLPSLFRKTADALQEDLKALYQLLDGRFKGADGIFQKLIAFIGKKKTRLNRWDQEETLLLHLTPLSMAAGFFGQYTKKIESSLAKQGISWPAVLIFLFSELGLKVMQITQLIKSGMNFQECYDHVVMTTELALEEYHESSWSDFEKRELLSSKKALAKSIQQLKLLSHLIVEEGNTANGLQRVLRLMQNLQLVSCLFDLREAISISRGIWPKPDFYYEQKFTPVVMSAHNAHIKTFTEKREWFATLLNWRKEKTEPQDFCEQLFVAISNHFQDIEKHIADTTNTMYRAFLTEKSDQLAFLEHQNEKTQASFSKIRILVVAIETAQRLYRQPFQESFLFWVDSDLNASLSDLKKRAQKIMGDMKEQIKKDILSKLKKTGIEAGKTCEERISELCEMKNIWIFSIAEMEGMIIDHFYFENEAWWTSDFRGALKRLDNFLRDEICARLARFESFDDLVMNLFSSDSHQTSKVDFDAEIKLVKRLIEIAGLLDENETQGPSIEFSYWKSFALKLQELKSYCEPLTQLPKLESNVDHSALIGFLKRRASILRSTKAFCAKLDEEMDRFVEDKDKEGDLEPARELLDNLEGAAKKLRPNETVPAEFDRLPSEHQAFFTKTYFPMQRAHEKKYADKIEASRQFILNYLEGKQRESDQDWGFFVLP